METVGRAVALVLKGNNVTMNAFCMLIDDVYGRRELHANELRGSGLSAATTLRPVRCSVAAISASDRVAEVLTILVIRQKPFKKKQFIPHF
jgi:hypothetical protein